MKPFDIEKAKAGAKVITRNGLAVRVLAFDIVGVQQPIVAAITLPCGEESVQRYNPDGSYVHADGKHGWDLFMAPVKVVKWVRVNDRGNGPYVAAKMFDSEQEARDAYPSAVLVAVAPIEWEE